MFESRPRIYLRLRMWPQLIDKMNLRVFNVFQSNIFAEEPIPPAWRPVGHGAQDDTADFETRVSEPDLIRYS